MITIDSASGIIQVPKINDYEELMNKIKEILQVNDELFKCLYFSYIDEEDQERVRLIPQIYDDFLNQEDPTVSIGFLDNIDNKNLEKLIDLIEQNKKRLKEKKNYVVLNNINDRKNNENEKNNHNENNEANNIINIEIIEKEEKEEKDEKDEIISDKNNPNNEVNINENININNNNNNKENDLDINKVNSDECFNLLPSDSKDINLEENNNNNINDNNNKENYNDNNQDVNSENSEDNIKNFDMKISHNVELGKSKEESNDNEINIYQIVEEEEKEDKEDKEEKEENKFEDNVKNIIENNMNHIKNDILNSLITQKSKIQKSKYNVVHNDVKCQICGTCPIVGIRYKCLECKDYDLCEYCEGVHGHPHPLLTLKKIFQQFQN